MKKESRVIDINFSKLGGPTYIGRPNGEAARTALKLEELEQNVKVSFLIDIPEGTYNINSSYFLGLFGKSVRAAGSAENFLSRFKFETHGKEYRAISRGIERALLVNKELNVG